MPKKKTNKEVKLMLEKKGLYDWDEIYINNDTPLNCRCKICNSVCHPRFSSLQGGHRGCFECFGSKKHTVEEVKMLLDKKDLYDWDGVYINNQTPLNCKCKICNSDCGPRLDHLLRGQGGCFKCSGTKKHTTEEVKVLLNERNLYDWDGVYISCNAPLKCKCKICGNNCNPSFKDLRRGQGGCIMCGALRAAKSMNNSAILYHWKTGKEIVCVASYEAAVIDYHNNNQIDYIWQTQTFTMPDGRTYRPDLYLPDTDTWVEIKGYFWRYALEKWEWFHKEYPNSELWDKAKLQEMNILRSEK